MSRGSVREKVFASCSECGDHFVGGPRPPQQALRTAQKSWLKDVALNARPEGVPSLWWEYRHTFAVPEYLASLLSSSRLPVTVVLMDACLGGHTDSECGSSWSSVSKEHVASHTETIESTTGSWSDEDACP